MRHRERRRFTVGTTWIGSRVAVALVSLPALATAQRPARDPVGAEELFRQGVAAKERNDWQTACDKFKKSLDLDPAVSTQYKVASCDEHDGKLAAAWYGYQSALKMNRETRSDRRRRDLDAAIRAALGKLEPRVPRLRITVTPAVEGLELVRNGDSLVPASVLGEALPVDPGEHTVVARAPGYLEQEIRVTVGEGHTLDASLSLVAAPPSPRTLATQASPSATTIQVQAPGAPSADATQTVSNASHQPQNGNASGNPSSAPHSSAPLPSATTPHSRWTQTHTAYTIGAAGIVSLLAAGYFGLRTLDYVEQMNGHERPDGTYDKGVYGPHAKAVNSQTAALALASVGAALGVLGVGLYVTAPREVSRGASAWWTCPLRQGKLTGVSVGGRW